MQNYKRICLNKYNFFLNLAFGQVARWNKFRQRLMSTRGLLFQWAHTIAWWSSTKLTSSSSSSHWHVTCSFHDIAEKLLTREHSLAHYINKKFHTVNGKKIVSFGIAKMYKNVIKSVYFAWTISTLKLLHSCM
jgi:hypothetical protein